MIPFAWREKLNISILAIKLPRLTIFFWLSLTVAGILAFSSLKYALFPELNFPVVLIQAKAPLATAMETETALTKPLESSLQSLTGSEIASTSYPGQAILRIGLETGQNLELATEKVKTAISDVNLPAETNLEVVPFNLNQSPVARYAVSSETISLEALATLTAAEIKPVLAALPGVNQVNLLGDGLLSAGTSGSLVRFQGQEVLALEIIKTADSNSLEVAKLVQKQIDLISQKNANVKITLAESQTGYIQEATQATLDALFGAIILAVLVIYLFLRDFQATLITALAIPISLLGTFIVMAMGGLNLETLTLLALALVIGVVVDDAIVEVENISRYLEAGEKPKEAAIKATQEIGLTVTASTLTIVAVFLPVAFMGGTLGQFFRPFGLTISAAVLTSLLVARTLSPVLAVSWLKPKKNSKKTPSLPFTNQYRQLLKWSLNHRSAVLAIALGSFILGIGLIPFIPKGFIPDLDRGEFNLVYSTALPNLAISPQASQAETNSDLDWLQNLTQSPSRFLLRRTRKVGEELEAAISSLPEISSTLNIMGVRGEPNKGTIYITVDRSLAIPTATVREKVREALPELKGVTTSVENILFVETGDDTPLKIALLGEDLATLEKLATEFKTKVTALPGLEDVKVTGSNQQSGVIERLNGQRVIYLSANLSTGEALGNATNKVMAIATDLIPPGIKVQLQGDAARQGEIFGQFGFTLSGAITCMLVTLIFPFGRLLEPLVVILCLPLSIVGAMGALLVTQSEFGMISLIGLIFLLGLIDKNAILLLDYANQLRAQGWPRQKALLETGVVRLRPIIMTSFSSILGMLPIAMGWGAGAELRQPMAVAIIGGLITSTLLSLIVAPVIYTLLEDYQQRLTRKLN